MSKKLELTGQRFGRLVVIGKSDKCESGHTFWICQCDCGNTKIIKGSLLTKGSTVSCGCKKIENQRLGLMAMQQKKKIEELSHPMEDPWEAGRLSYDARYCPVL